MVILRWERSSSSSLAVYGKRRSSWTALRKSRRRNASLSPLNPATFNSFQFSFYWVSVPVYLVFFLIHWPVFVSLCIQLFWSLWNNRARNWWFDCYFPHYYLTVIRFNQRISWDQQVFRTIKSFPKWLFDNLITCFDRRLGEGGEGGGCNDEINRWTYLFGAPQSDLTVRWNITCRDSFFKKRNQTQCLCNEGLETETFRVERSATQYFTSSSFNQINHTLIIIAFESSSH